MTKNVIFFDGGGSGIRAKSQSADGTSIAKNYPGFSPGELPLVDYLSNLIIDFAGEVGGRIDRAVLAVATLPADDQKYGDIAKSVLASANVNELWICSDSVSACAAAIEKDGVVIAAGTGTTALAVGRNRSMIHSLAGDGFLLGDEGSAFWIGKMALNSALRARDGRGGSQEPPRREGLPRHDQGRRCRWCWRERDQPHDRLEPSWCRVRRGEHRRADPSHVRR